MSKARAKGTAAERDVVRYLQNWWPAAERRALSGNKDRGDVAGIPGVVIEVKAAARLELAAWRRETEAECRNASAAIGLLVVKRPRKPVSQWDAHMRLTDLGGDVYPVLRQGEGEMLWFRMDVALAVGLIRAQGF